MRKKDGMDMSKLLPTVFLISATKLNLQLSPKVVALRQQLGEKAEYYFIATANDAHTTQSSQIDVELTFIDACRKATVIPKTLRLPSPFFRAQEKVVTAFEPFIDSVDQLEFYDKGICGEKQVILNPASPAYLSVHLNLIDPINENFTIVYEDEKAEETDLGNLIDVKYWVRFKDYSAIIPDFPASFTFEIKSNCFATLEN